MKYALFILDQSGAIDITLQSLRNFASSVQALTERIQGVERLNIGSYLVNLEHGLHSLRILDGEAERRNIQSRTLFFEEVPSFVISKPSPE